MSNTLERVSNIDSEQALELANKSEINPLLLQNYVNGGFCRYLGPCIDSVNPQTGKTFAQVPNSSEDEVAKAVAAAKQAFPLWSKTPKSQRSCILNRIADLIAARRETFAAWESIDQGKPLARARVEIERAESNFRYFAGYILHDEGAARMTDDNCLTYEHRSPLGVFALISPWNMPLYLLTWKIAPCIAFGCTGVAKPSEMTSMSAFLLAGVFQEAGLPPGVMNIVFGAGLPTGSALVRSPIVRGVSFTGGTATGLQIRKDTIEDIGKHLSLELGGKNPTLVFPDADMQEAVKLAATAGFENQGEICLCGSRIYVERTVFDDFVQKFVAYVSASYKVGERVGAVVSLAHYHKVRSYLVQAEKEGAHFALGEVPVETPAGGYWIKPTILTGVSTSSVVMREEIFGPVVTIAPFDAEEEAISLANDNPNGLAAVVLTRDGARMRRVAEQLEAGLVWVNCWLVRQLATPFGGMKSSGTGREGGSYSRDVFTTVRTVHLPM
ncbi:hypothetical protein LTR85_007760 [Meristemomyces frigidus]|nr:hypothetical protein LTR85_007760 [Meristemomyces frigidus]